MITEIEEGQKLKGGDFFNGNALQVREILGINKCYERDDDFIVDSGVAVYYCDIFDQINGMFLLIINSQEYSFEAFKQLCINTFQSEK